jgi:hypothetical protein
MSNPRRELRTEDMKLDRSIRFFSLMVAAAMMFGAGLARTAEARPACKCSIRCGNSKCSASGATCACQCMEGAAVCGGSDRAAVNNATLHNAIAMIEGLVGSDIDPIGKANLVRWTFEVQAAASSGAADRLELALNGQGEALAELLEEQIDQVVEVANAVLAGPPENGPAAVSP